MIQQIAEFMELPCDGKLLQTVMEQTSHSYMSSPEHKHRFDDRRMVESWWRSKGLTLQKELTGKVRKSGGKAGQGAKGVSPRVKQILQQAWDRIVEPRTGFKNCVEMRAALQQELKEQAAWRVARLGA